MKSIRGTLRLWLFLGAFGLLLAAALALYAGVRWLLVDQFDAGLKAKLGTFTTLIEQDGDSVELGFIDVAMPEFSSASEPEYVQMWLADRSDDWVLYRSPSLGELQLPRLGGTAREPAFQSLRLPDGRAGRGIGAEFAIHNYDPGQEGRSRARVALVLAKGTAQLEAALRTLLIGTAGLIAGLLLAGFLLVGIALRRGLQPLDRFARHVAEVDDPSRAAAFESKNVPQELAPLVQRHNHMLARLRRAFERERRTAANIAHELRTPVAELVALTETAQQSQSDPSESARLLGELRVLGDEMSGRIATLLELARMEMGETPLEMEPIDLAELVKDCWAPLAGAAGAKRQGFRMRESPGLLVQSDRVALSILVANLLRNAVDHAPEGDQIHCTIAVRARECWLYLANHSNGQPSSNGDSSSDPFAGTGPARADRHHAGLGLLLAKRLADLLEVKIEFQIDQSEFKVGLQFGLS